MPEYREQVSLIFRDNDGRPVGTAIIRAEIPDTLQILSEDEVREFGEEPIQLFEERIYEYLLKGVMPRLRLADVTGGRLVVNSLIEATTDRGRIEPGSSTGLLPLLLVNEAGDSVARAAVEVCSLKLGYRDDYREMLDFIAEKSTDLLLDMQVPSQVRLVPDPGRDPETIYQRFAFLKSLIDSRAFRDAIRRIIAIPHQVLQQESYEQDIRHRLKLDGKSMRQLVGGKRRIPLPDQHPLASRMRALGIPSSSLPATVLVQRSHETVDTPENRFVKHALNLFVDFLVKIEDLLVQPKISSETGRRMLREVARIREDLVEVLSRNFFQEIGEPRMLPLGSPVLQRRGGYSEVLQAWFKFNLAADLVWQGGDDVYGAGKRDLPILYEYWLFFHLLELVARQFHLSQPPSRSLIEATEKGFGLKLKSGRTLILDGAYVGSTRRMHIQFSYNRPFNKTGGRADQGSWTIPMRPDFTLSLWPEDFTEVEAEQQELIVHLHFDAKYKVNRLGALFGKEGTNLDLEKSEQLRGIYKQVDLWKMHAYRDTIRRSEGAYVLYPGSENRTWYGFHEILPGIGAFAVYPGEEGKAKGLDELGNFIADVVSHLCDRATQREQLTYHLYRTYLAQQRYSISTPLPERNLFIPAQPRELPPNEHYVLICRYESADHLAWIRANCLYVFSVGSVDSALTLEPKLVQAHHLLLCTRDNHALPGLWGMVQAGPRIFASYQLRGLEYPMPIVPDDIYIGYDIQIDGFFEKFVWEPDKLVKIIPPAPNARPSLATLAQILGIER